jgi:hypothetical protein
MNTEYININEENGKNMISKRLMIISLVLSLIISITSIIISVFILIKSGDYMNKTDHIDGSTIKNLVISTENITNLSINQDNITGLLLTQQNITGLMLNQQNVTGLLLTSENITGLLLDPSNITGLLLTMDNITNIRIPFENITMINVTDEMIYSINTNKFIGIINNENLDISYDQISGSIGADINVKAYGVNISNFNDVIYNEFYMKMNFTYIREAQSSNLTILRQSSNYFTWIDDWFDIQYYPGFKATISIYFNYCSSVYTYMPFYCSGFKSNYQNEFLNCSINLQQGNINNAYPFNPNIINDCVGEMEMMNRLNY